MAAPGKDSLLMNENDFKTTLMNQKLRAEQHRSNYETLKAQHVLLQKDHVALQSEHKALSEQYDMMKNKFEEIIGQLQQERDDKIAECEQVKAQVLTGQKLDVIKLRVAEEIEAPYRKHVQLMENELETFRSDYNKLRYNYSFLKSEHENIKSKHQAIIEEMQARHQAEISRYQNERKEFLSRQEQDIPATIKQTRQLQRENTELEQRVKSLLAELEEKEGKIEQAAIVSEQSNRSLSKRISEAETINQSLEREATTLREHIKRLQDEISQTHKQHLSVSEEVMAAQRQNTTLQRQIDELNHSHKATISELTMKHAQQCSDLTRQRDSAMSELESCQSRIEVMEQAFHQQEASLANMNRELERRVQEVKEQEWNRIATLQQDKMQLEEELSKAQKQNAGSLSDQQTLTNKFHDQIRQLEIDKASLKEELEEVQSQSHRQAGQLKNCQQELLSLRATQKKYQSLQAEHHNLEDNKQQLQTRCDKLESTVKLLEEQLGIVKMEAQKGQYEYAAAMDKQKKLWEEEYSQLTSKLSYYKERLRSSQEKLSSSQDVNRKQRRLYKQKTQELKRKVELLQAKEEQLVLERNAIKKLYDVESEKNKRKFLEIQRRQKEFHFLLQQDHMQPLVIREPTMFAPLKNLANQQQQHKRQLQEVNDRLEEIATVTNQHHVHHSISSDSLVSNHGDDHSQS